MPDTDLTTLLCLFHHQDHAQAALEDILKTGVPEANVTMIGPGSSIASTQASLAELNVPKRDQQHLLDGISGGGALLTVSALSSLSDKVEAIFKDHSAEKIDEAEVDDDMSAQALPPAAGFAGEPFAGDALPLVAGTAATAATAYSSVPLVEGSPLLDVDDTEGKDGLDSASGNPAEYAAEPYNAPYDEMADVRVFRVVALPTTAMGADQMVDEVVLVPLDEDFDDIEPVGETAPSFTSETSPMPSQPTSTEDVDPRELGLDTRMNRPIVQVD